MTDKIEQLITELSALNPETNQHIFFMLLKRGKVNFKNLSEAYASYLEESRSEIIKKMADLNSNLAMYVTSHNTKPEDTAVHRYTSLRSLVNAGAFSGTQFEKEMKKTVLAKEILFDAEAGETVDIDGLSVHVQIIK